MSMVTLKDIAEKAEVSISLVSKVVNNKMGNSTVSKEKADKILRIAHEMGYVPNISARSLRLGRLDTITVLLPYSKDAEVTSYYDFMLGILEASGETNYNVSCVFYSQTDEDKNELQCLRHIAQTPVAGFIYLPTFRALIDESCKSAIRDILSNNIPILSCIVRYDSVDGVYYSIVDDAQCSYVATKHCLDKGYKDIIYINSGAMQRNVGFMQAMDEVGIDPGKLMIENRESFFRVEGYKVFMELIKDRKPLPEAIIATCDMHAMGIIDAMEECGITTDEIEVVGIDGFKSLRLLKRKYTTVVQPFFDMGYNAVLDMVKKIEKGEMENKNYAPYIEEVDMRGYSL